MKIAARHSRSTSQLLKSKMGNGQDKGLAERIEVPVRTRVQ